MLQGFARGSPTGIGLLVSIDHEGGRVNRFRSFLPFVQFPPAWYVGARGDPAYVEAAAYLMAKDLASVGIMLNLAPVLDLSDRPDAIDRRRPGASGPIPPASASSARHS